MFSTRCPCQAPNLIRRAFTTTSRQSWKSNKNALAETHANLPAYPHGPSQWFKQSNKGLYGGSRLQFGNNISPDTETKSRRTWHPNINPKSLFSKSLRRYIKLRVTTRVLRTIDKVGGLDEYLLGEKSARIRELGMGGWRLRCLVMGTKKVQNQFNAQRLALGLPVVDYAALARDINPPPPELLDASAMGEFEEFQIEDFEHDPGYVGYYAAQAGENGGEVLPLQETSK